MPSPPNTPQRIPRLSPPTTASRWQAIVNHDAAVDFVYAVLTTQIYCRPSCPARRARRANVRFYDTPAQAEKAGFRPCKRCHPQSPHNPQTAMIEKACEDIQTDLAAGLKPRLQELAARAGLTPSHFHRVFKKHLGVTPGQYVNGTLHSDAVSSSSTSSTETTELDVLRGGLGEVDDDDADGWRGDLLDLDDGVVDCAAAGLSDVGFLGGEEAAWNDFDVLFAAAELEQPGLLHVDPRVLSSRLECGVYYGVRDETE